MANVRTGRDRDLTSGAVEEPSWAIPVVVLSIVAILSVGFLAYYFAPNLGDLLRGTPKPSEEAAEVEVVIGGVRHRIPANFTRFAYARRGGVQDRVELYALLPDFEPYSPERATAFQDNSDDSQVVHFEVEAYRVTKMGEADRLKKVFLKLVLNPEGERGPHGLRRYQFDPETGYRDQELFARESDDGTVVLFRCFKNAPDIFSPNCSRDLRLSNEITLTYRFKRTLLGDWRDIDSGIQALARSFRVAQQSQ